jgi:hypothetical protein
MLRQKIKVFELVSPTQGSKSMRKKLKYTFTTEEMSKTFTIKNSNIVRKISKE